MTAGQFVGLGRHWTSGLSGGELMMLMENNVI
jgi:hypothetical protein